LSTLTLLIVLDKNTIFIFRLLTSKLAVYLGKISFGVYLWHWPLLVFYQYGQISNLSSFERFCILVMSICLASASNRFIEIPARSSLRISDKRILLITTAGITVTIVFSILGIVSGGFESYKTQTMTESNLMRYRAEKVDWVDNNKCIFNSVSFTSEEFLERMEGCHKRLGKAVVLLGDSHGQEIFNALALNLGDQFLLGVTRGGCRPHSPSEECQYKEFLTFQKTHQKMIKAVIFHQAGFYLLSDSSGGDGDRSLFSTIARVKGMPVYPVNFNFVSKNLDYLKLLDRTIPVIWLGPYIEPHYNVIDLVSHSQSCSQDIYDIPENQIRTFQNLDRELGNVLPKRSNVTYLSLMSALNFRWDKDLYDCETVFWADGDHWSPDGEARFGTRIQNLLNTKRLFL
jgi:hypothetical protein